MGSNHGSRNLDQQGFSDLTPEEQEEVKPWLRLAPGTATAIAIAGLAAESAGVFAASAVLSSACSMLGSHPVDALYNHSWRYVLGTRPLPPYPAPRRFACGLAALWQAVIAVLFQAGATGPAMVLGFAFALAAMLPATTDFCIGSALFHALGRSGGGQRAADLAS